MLFIYIRPVCTCINAAFVYIYRSDDDVDSEVEEALYSQVHYASSLLVSENSTPGINALH